MNILKEVVKQTKKRLLQMHFESRVGHIGGNLSCLDILMVLYHRLLGPDDQFVLSKGHAAGALYATLWSCGKLSDQDLQDFHQEQTRLSAHPPASGINDILFATGSLGHGLSLAAGLAMAKMLQSQPGRVFCLMSDGEWNEGSCWEALIFANHHQLNRLTIIVDCNGLQGFGTTREVADLEPIEKKFNAFGTETVEIDGHDLESLYDALTIQDRLRIIVAKTRKGNGVSYMENKMEWHYLPMTAELYQQALAEVELDSPPEKNINTLSPAP